MSPKRRTPGMLSGIANSQDKAPTNTPSITNTPTMASDVAPMARMTPISRVRSTTLIDMVLINPMPPTVAVKTDMVSSR